MKTKTQLSIATLAFICLSVLPNTQALNPPPDGGYPGGNTAEGYLALGSLTTGAYNTAVGVYSVLSLTAGNFCTGIGAGALLANTADENTATGAGALFSNTTGDFNTATGTFALFSNTTGQANNAFGVQALRDNTIGSDNTAIGDGALLSNTTGDQNSASGVDALLSNTAGDQNTATGTSALFFNNGIQNTATGYSALANNTTGNSNTATGTQALFSNTTGFANTAEGQFALANNTTGVDNIALGSGTASNVTTASHVIVIGSSGANVSNTCFIGNIRDVTTQNADAIAVVIDSAGQLGTVSSSARFKKEIEPMDKASEAILALKPVTFHYKSDKSGTPQFGLIAEEVAELNPDLVVRDKNGNPYTVRYEAVNSMLLNEFLKEHHKVEKLEAMVGSLAAIVKEQGAQLQHVSAEVRLNKPAAKIISRNP